MYPDLFSIGDFTVHTYGVMILIGAVLGVLLLVNRAAKEANIKPDQTLGLILPIVLAAFLGGKLFLYFEDPAYYFSKPSRMLQNVQGGFVFYGSLLLVIPTAAWYFRKHKWPTWHMLDLLALITPIVHAFGRLGCFFAGCCHGLPTDSWMGITFTNEQCMAEPLNTPLWPTQLFEVGLNIVIFSALWMLNRKKRFHGQIALVYGMVYAIGRSITEVFRGDEERGFIIGDWLSHSQFISLLLFAAAIAFYIWKVRKGSSKR